MTESAFSRNYYRFRLLLMDIRKEAGLTQAQLGHKLGRTQSYVSKYESGERRLDVIEFLDITSALGVDATDFIRKLQEDIASLSSGEDD